MSEKKFLRLLICLKSSFKLLFVQQKIGFEIKLAVCYIRAFDCSIRELRYLCWILSPPGAGFAGTIILQLSVYDSILLSSLMICFML